MKLIVPTMKKKQKKYIIFSVLFFMIVFATPLLQAIVEYRKDKTIQAFDIFADAIVTPFNRAVRLHGFAVKLFRTTDSLEQVMEGTSDTAVDRDRAGRYADEALIACSEMKRVFCTVNRQMTIDSTGPEARVFDSLSVLLSYLSPANPESLSELQRIVDRLVRKYPSPAFIDAPLLCAKALPYIFWNDRYIRSYEKELEKNSIFASAIRPWILHAWYILFNDPGNKAILGRTGWYFYTPDVEYLVKPSILDPRYTVVNPNSNRIIDNPIYAIEHFKKQLSTRGIDLLVVIVPGKPSVYPDLLTRKINLDQGSAFSHSNDIIGELRRRGVETIDLFTPFAEERGHDGAEGDSIYLRQDTHWKVRALRCAAKAVARRIKCYPWFSPGAAEYTMDSVIIEKAGDVAVMSSQALLGRSDRTDGLLTEKIKCLQVYQINRDDNGRQGGRVLYKDDFRSSRILILGDSFSRIYQTDEPRGAGWIAHLAMELSQPVASIVNDGGASTLARRSLARRVNLLKGKKLVVWEIVERDFRFGAEGWKDVDL